MANKYHWLVERVMRQLGASELSRIAWMTEDEFLRVPGAGKVSLARYKEALASERLQFGANVKTTRRIMDRFGDIALPKNGAIGTLDASRLPAFTLGSLEEAYDAFICGMACGLGVPSSALSGEHGSEQR